MNVCKKTGKKTERNQFLPYRKPVYSKRTSTAGHKKRNSKNEEAYTDSD